MAPRRLSGAQLSVAGTAARAGTGCGSAARLLGLNVTHSRSRRRRGLPQPLARISITILVQKERGEARRQAAAPLPSPPAPSRRPCQPGLGSLRPSVVRGRPLFQGDQGLQEAGERLRLQEAPSLSQRPLGGPTSGRPGGLPSLRGLREPRPPRCGLRWKAPRAPVLLRRKLFRQRPPGDLARRTGA